MAIKVNGSYAPYKFTTECWWCTGQAPDVLRSDSYGSCVGLVLYGGPRHKTGVVAHYAGGLGGNPQKAYDDTLEILRDVCPVLPGIWKGWVFGGTSLSGNQFTSTVEQTKTLIDTVRKALYFNPYIPVNKLKNHKDFQAPEMTGEYVAHGGVKLNLADGKITWTDGRGAEEKQQVTKKYAESYF